MRRTFTVVVSSRDWVTYGLDSVVRRRTALAALYNGYGMEKLRKLMTGDMDTEECIELRRVAKLLGLTDQDDIVRSADDRTQQGERPTVLPHRRSSAPRGYTD